MGPPVPRVAVGAIVIHDGSILLVERARPPADGLWTIPGGKVEAGEPVVNAVRREVAEETGLAVVVGHFVGWVERLGPDHHFVIMDFEAAPAKGWVGDTEGHPLVVAGDDASAVRWVDLGDLMSTPACPLVDGLASFLADHGYI